MILTILVISGVPIELVKGIPVLSLPTDNHEKITVRGPLT